MNNRDILNRLRSESDDITISNDVESIKGESRADDTTILPRKPRVKWLNRIITLVILFCVSFNLVWSIVEECQVRSVVVLDADESVTLSVNRSGRVIGVSVEGEEDIVDIGYYFKPVDTVINSMYTTINRESDMMLLCTVSSEDARTREEMESYLRDNVSPLTVVKESGQEYKWKYLERDLPKVRFLLATKILLMTDEYNVHQLKQMDARQLYELYQSLK
ncbi:MAG: hypothetical protein IKD20_01580 [Clostridia bacterium]|nr:hypothetical protein [Clostridia bacterium]